MCNRGFKDDEEHRAVNISIFDVGQDGFSQLFLFVAHADSPGDHEDRAGHELWFDGIGAWIFSAQPQDFPGALGDFLFCTRN